MRRPDSPFNRLVRAGLWIAYRGLRVWWFIARPHHHGAVVAIWLDDRILMVRQSYRDRWGWPGGGINPGEGPVDAVLRELDEELDLSVPRESLIFRSVVVDRWEFRYDHAQIFELSLNAEPLLHPDGREVIEARFMTPTAALSLPLVPFVAAYLQTHRYGPTA